MKWVDATESLSIHSIHLVETAVIPTALSWKQMYDAFCTEQLKSQATSLFQGSRMNITAVNLANKFIERVFSRSDIKWCPRNKGLHR